MTHIVAGNTAPGFSLKSLDNREYSLNALMDRGPAVAAFFKVSCPVCQFTFPFLERLYKRYGGDGVTFLGISQDGARDTTKFAKEYGVTFSDPSRRRKRLSGLQRLRPDQRPHSFPD